MKKLSNFVWLLAIALGAAIALTACSKNSDGPDGGEDKGKVEVNPTKVFVNGMPKIVDGSVFTRDFKGRLSSIYNVVFHIQQRGECLSCICLHQQHLRYQRCA